MSSGDPDLGPHASTASVLPTELSLQPHYEVLLRGNLMTEFWSVDKSVRQMSKGEVGTSVVSRVCSSFLSSRFAWGKPGIPAS